MGPPWHVIVRKLHWGQTMALLCLAPLSVYLLQHAACSMSVDVALQVTGGHAAVLCKVSW